MTLATRDLPRLDDVGVCRAAGSRVQLRAVDDDGQADDGSPGTMFGRFATFNSWYEIDSFWEGRFVERLAAGAFDRTIRVRDGETPIRVLLEHGFDPSVGDKPLGVPSLIEERDTGPYAEVPLLATSYNTDLAAGLRAGAYSQSFRFRVLIDEWVEPGSDEWEPTGNPAWDALLQRTIREVRLIEFGPTVFPANPSADAGLRSALRSTTDDYRRRLSQGHGDGFLTDLGDARWARHPGR